MYTILIDANGKAVIPGFNDSHIHLYSLGKSLQSVQLYGCKSVEEVIERSKKFIKDNNIKEGSFITGRGWNQDYFPINQMITRHDLDKISTNHPIIFNRACGHVATCNTKALEVCGIDCTTKQIEGSEFYYDNDGITPNGIFAEAAIQVFLESKIPTPSKKDMVSTLKIGVEYALSQGITSVQTNDISSDNYKLMFEVYEELYKVKPNSTRAYHQCFFTKPNEYSNFINDGFVTGYGNNYNKIGPLKMFVDGSLGARTALMRNSYNDDNTTSGIACMTQEEIDSMVKVANENNCQVAIHAIGDKAIEMVLDSYKEENNLRNGIIHCQITDEQLINRFKENNILAYVQPIFIHYDMHIVESRVGKQLASTSYAFGDMYRKGINVSYGTDCPVEDLKTMDNLYCATVRKDLEANPKEGYYKEQAVTIEEAITLYTQGGAYSSFEENIKGKLQSNYLADLAILDTDIFNMDLENLRNVKVLKTIVGGKIAYESN